MTKLSAQCSARLLLGFLLLGTSPSWAETIKLKEGGTVEAQLLQVQDDQVIVGLPREAIVTVNGKALPPVLAAGVEAPAFQAKDMGGQARAVGKGTGKATLLHFWVQWCPHCRSDAPQVQALHDRFKDDLHVQVLTVNLDQEREKVEAFVSDHHVTYPVLLATEIAAAGGANLLELYQINGFPATYVIDAEGIIRRKVVGSFVETSQDLGALLAELRPKSVAAAATLAILRLREHHR